MMLYLVRHANPQIDPTVAANKWQLSRTGMIRAQSLARHLEGCKIQVVVSSTEPKAIQTAQILADQFGCHVELADGLQEHARPLLPGSFTSPGEFKQRVKAFFEQPGQLVLGAESADQCFTRFNGALCTAIERHAGKTMAVVTHGTVISLLLNSYNHLDPYPFWQALGMPTCITVDLPDFTIRGMWTPPDRFETSP
jgi:broad specificity phosphatase PhoE